MNCKRVKVRVAATSANLGGGFDCMGLALGIYHTVTVEPSDRLEITSNTDAPSDASNLIYTSMNEVFKRYGAADKKVSIRSVSDIPQASGLGSSASCIVAGVTAANVLLNARMSGDEILSLCAALDGHPDNVLPALKGGVTAGYIAESGKVEFVRATARGRVSVAVATPDFPLPTSKARAALPETYKRADCVYSLSRAVVTFAALSSDENASMLKAVGDRLHEPYRKPLIKGYDEVEAAFMATGAVSCCISGAGPSVLAFYVGGKKCEPALPRGWTVRYPVIDNSPVYVASEYGS